MLNWVNGFWVDVVYVFDHSIPQASCHLCHRLPRKTCKFYNQKAHHSLVDALSAKMTMVIGAAFKTIL